MSASPSKPAWTYLNDSKQAFPDAGDACFDSAEKAVLQLDCCAAAGMTAVGKFSDCFHQLFIEKGFTFL